MRRIEAVARQDQCPLCGAGDGFERVEDVRHRWHRVCGACGLIFVEDEFLPSAGEERARYAKHRNGPHDAGYVSFLRQAVEASAGVLPMGGRGLDFGCGHTPTLRGLLETEGFSCEVYDSFFFPQMPEGPFEFIFATEVVEHFHVPSRDWRKMAGLLAPRGWLIVMTAPWTTLEEFRTWGYASDGTHVCFYRWETMEWIARAFGMELRATENPRVFLFRLEG